MRLLLDTHVFLWRLLEPRRLSEAQRAALDDAANNLFLSPISVWETLILASKGRLEMDDDPERFVAGALSSSPVEEAPLSFDIALRSQRLDSLPTQDPADRFLVATALVEGMTLVTSDQKLLGFSGLSTLP